MKPENFWKLLAISALAVLATRDFLGAEESGALSPINAANANVASSSADDIFTTSSDGTILHKWHRGGVNTPPRYVGKANVQ